MGAEGALAQLVEGVRVGVMSHRQPNKHGGAGAWWGRGGALWAVALTGVGAIGPDSWGTR